MFIVHGSLHTDYYNIDQWFRQISSVDLIGKKYNAKNHRTVQHNPVCGVNSCYAFIHLIDGSEALNFRVYICTAVCACIVMVGGILDLLPSTSGCHLCWFDLFLVLRLKLEQSNKCTAVCKVATVLQELTCHFGSHSVTCHPAEVTFPPLGSLNR